MELVLESKLTKNIDVNQSKSDFYSIYSLESNKSSDSSVSNPLIDSKNLLNKDFTLSLLSNNLPVANEAKLKENLLKKIEKGTLYASQTGNISTFELGFGDVKRSICYHNIYKMSDEQNTEYLICFVMVNGENDLDLFRAELDFYFERSLKNYFNSTVNSKYKNKEFTVSNELSDLLLNWLSNSIGCLHRGIALLKENLPVFIEEAFSCGRIECKELSKDKEHDLEVLFGSFNCTQLIMRSTLEKEKSADEIQKAETSGIEPLVISDGSEGIRLSKSEKSQFAMECADSLGEVDKKDMFALKQIIEGYKLKLIQDLNTFNRYLIKGKSHYYDLFKSVLHLKYSKNSEILMKIYKNSENNEANVMNVFDVVADFYNNINLEDEEAPEPIQPKVSVKQQDTENRILNNFIEKFPKN